MNREQLLELVPHYLAMVLLVVVALSILRATVGDLGFWPELGIVLVLVVLYQPLVRYLDREPSAWNRD